MKYDPFNAIVLLEANEDYEALLGLVERNTPLGFVKHKLVTSEEDCQTPYLRAIWDRFGDQMVGAYWDDSCRPETDPDCAMVLEFSDALVTGVYENLSTLRTSGETPPGMIKPAAFRIGAVLSEKPFDYRKGWPEDAGVAYWWRFGLYIGTETGIARIPDQDAI